MRGTVCPAAPICCRHKAVVAVPARAVVVRELAERALAARASVVAQELIVAQAPGWEVERVLAMQAVPYPEQIAPRPV